MAGVLAFVVLAGVLLGAFNIVLDEYARGAVRAALEQGAQAGATSGGSEAQCFRAAVHALDSLLHGSFARGIRLYCAAAPGQMIAHASGSLPSFLPVVPVMRLQMDAIAGTSAGAP